MTRPEERREFQRLRIESSIPATLGAIPATLVEIGVLGARVEHEQKLDFEKGDLRFAFDGNQIALQCRIMRTTEVDDAGHPTFESGLRFLTALDDSGDRLRAMLGILVTKALDVLREQPHTVPLEPAIDFDQTFRARQTAYVSYRLEGGIWLKRRLFLPEQPPVGFTIARSHDGEEIDRLCRIYQGSDDEGRRLIRMFAELSVSAALEIPPNA